jgi:hypothetical protein
MLSELTLYCFKVAVERDRPLALQDEIDLSDIAFLFVHVSIFCFVCKFARHEAKRYLIEEIVVELFARFEKASKRGQINDVCK